MKQQQFQMINNLRCQQKAKICTVYHNYNLSTKNFDGNLLYQLFLASGHLNKTDIQFPQKGNAREAKNESRCSMRASLRSDLKKFNGVEKLQEKSSKILKLITSEYEKRRQSTQFNTHKIESQGMNEQNYRSTFHETLHKSMESAKNNQSKNGEQARVSCMHKYTQSQNYHQVNMQFTNYPKRPMSRNRRKEKLKAQDFFKPEIIESDPWVQGKLGGFSAQYISVISNNKRIYSFEGDTIRQVASLTKIMTCITALYLTKKYELDINTHEVKVTRRAAMLNGTTAELVTGDVLNLIDLLYAMMLPSGNDAAQAIADFFNKYVQEKEKGKEEGGEGDGSPGRYKEELKQGKGEQIFIQEMNKLAQYLKMKNTHFDNPHGLSNKNNYSTANDMVQLCHYAMKNPTFRQIVKCQERETKIFSSRQKMKRTVKWLNTNKLLSLDHCDGIKTGITPTAGPCMAASFQREGFNVIIVILNAKSKSKRFQEVKNLYEWAEKQIVPDT